MRVGRKRAQIGNRTCAAWKIDTAGAHGARKEISLIKLYGARVPHDVVDKVIQVFGAA